MGRVAESLDSYLAALVERGSRVTEFLRAGPPEAEVVSAIEEAGLTPTPDVVEWFSWFDGVSHGRRRTYLFKRRHPVGIRQALQERIAILAQAEDDSLPDEGLPAQLIFRSSWLPVLADQPVTVVDTETGSDEGSVWDVWFDEPPRRRFASLADFVDLERARLESGEVRVAPDGRLALVHEPDVLSEWEGAGTTLFNLGVGELGSIHRVKLPAVIRAFRGRQATSLKILGSPTGHIDGNEGLEDRQLQLVVDELVSLGLPPESAVVERAESDETSVHRIKFFTKSPED